MWQRIQTLLILGAVMCLAVMLFLPLWSGSDGNDAVTLFPFYLELPDKTVYSPYFGVAILVIASIVVGLIQITRYNNRLQQIKLGALNSLLMSAGLVAAVLFVRDLQIGFEGSFKPATFLPIAAMMFNMIANRFIRRDQKLVEESNRLR